MLQRKQTLYLIIVAILMALMLFLSLGKFLVGGYELTLQAFGLFKPEGDGTLKVASMMFMGIMIVISTLLPLITIGLFKNRKLQNTLCIAIMAALVVTQILVVYYLCDAKIIATQLASVPIATSYSPVALFPVIAIIFTWLAKRGIMKDERLVRSMDRLR